MSSFLKSPFLSNPFKKTPTRDQISGPKGGKRVVKVEKDPNGYLVGIPSRWADFLKESETELKEQRIPKRTASKYIRNFAAEQERSFVENKVEEVDESDDGFDSDSDGSEEELAKTPTNEELYTPQLTLELNLNDKEGKSNEQRSPDSDYYQRETINAGESLSEITLKAPQQSETHLPPRFQSRSKPELPPKPSLKPPEPPKLPESPKRTSEELQLDMLDQIKRLCNERENPQHKYATGSVLGKGGCATVYTANQRGTKETVAIKCIDISDQSLKLNFVHQEIKCLLVTHHKNIVNFVECFMIAQLNQLWIVMECCGGGCLTDIVTRKSLREQLTESRIASVSHEILQALQYLHQNHLIHRDIKSDNVLTKVDGSIKLGDFGYCAKICQNEKRETVLGTRCWMAPEVVRGKPYDEKIDIWSFGITVLEMLDGEPPYIHQAPMKTFELIAKGRPKIVRANEITSSLLNFVNKSLEPDPRTRASAAQLLAHKFMGERDDLKSFAKIVHSSLSKNRK